MRGMKESEMFLIASLVTILAGAGRSAAEKGVFVCEIGEATSVPIPPVMEAWQFRLVNREPSANDAKAFGNLPVAYKFSQGQSDVIIAIARNAPKTTLGLTHFFSNWTGLDTALNRGIACLEANQPSMMNYTQSQTWSPGRLQTSMVTWGYGHGMYTKMEMYVMYLDRLIRLRMPNGSASLRQLDEQSGWLGDVSEFNNFPYIAPMKDYTKNKSKAVWLPDAYFAALWRAYMAWEADLNIFSPVSKYWIHRTHGFEKTFTPDQSLAIVVEDWTPVPAGGMSPGDHSTYKRRAVRAANRVRVEFYDGNRLLGTKTTAPYVLSGIKLSPGLHGLIAISVYDDGSRGISRPACLIVKGDMYAPTAVSELAVNRSVATGLSPVSYLLANRHRSLNGTTMDLQGRSLRVSRAGFMCIRKPQIERESP